MNADAPFYHAVAFGDPGLHPTIAGIPVTVEHDHSGHVVVTDDCGAHHDFWAVTWGEIKASMADYFGVVETGR